MRTFHVKLCQFSHIIPFDVFSHDSDINNFSYNSDFNAFSYNNVFSYNSEFNEGGIGDSTEMIPQTMIILDYSFSQL